MTTQPAGDYVPAFVLSDRLRKAREHASLDQSDLARELGIARATVSNYERGLVEPRRAVVMAWAMRTGVSLHWIQTGEDPHQDDGPNGGLRARPEGLEPPTFWLGAFRHLQAVPA